MKLCWIALDTCNIKQRISLKYVHASRFHAIVLGSLPKLGTTASTQVCYKANISWGTLAKEGSKFVEPARIIEQSGANKRHC